MNQAYQAFPARPKYKAIWVGVQLLAVIPYMVVGCMALEMVFAEPGKGYVGPSGKYIACEALASRSRASSPPRCASFDSMETNPAGIRMGGRIFCLLERRHGDQLSARARPEIFKRIAA